MTYLLALDQGTTSSRAIAFDAQGRIAALAQREFTQHFPSPGQVEHDADEIWQTQLAVARECVQKLGSADADMAAIAPNIAAIGITNQRETTVLWSRETGRPVAPAIVWQDRRTTARCEALSPAERQLIQSRTGLVPDAYFSATKLQWLLDNVPGAPRRAEAGELAFGTVDSWLAWNLTGGAKGGGLHVTDASNASRTMLMNLHTLQWDDELLALFGIPRAVLPRIVPSSGEIGATAPDLLGAPIRIAGIAGDQQAATFGHGCLAPGMAKNTYGTGCFMLMNTGGQPAASRNNLLMQMQADALGVERHIFGKRIGHQQRQADIGGAAHGGIGQAVGIGKSGFLARNRPHAHALVDLETAGLDHAFFQMPALECGALAVDVGVIDVMRADDAQAFGEQLRGKVIGFEQIALYGSVS